MLVYFHGGGMVMGSNHSFEPLARTLAAESNATVVAVDYRLAPENPPPAQFDDAYTATAWVADNADRLGVDPSRLAVVGDSAGGSLAAAVALAARDHDGPAICCSGAALPRPRSRHGRTVDHSAGRRADALRSTTSSTCTTSPTAVRAHRTTPTACPPTPRDLSGLPPAIVVTGECDPIRDWGERYAARLRDAGVQTTVTRYPGMYHGFLMRSDATARGRLAIAEIGALLRAKFAHPAAVLTSWCPDHRTRSRSRTAPDRLAAPQSTSTRRTEPEETSMLTDERRMELSDVLRPAAPPGRSTTSTPRTRRERLLDVVRTQGPWKLIIAQHFASADELMATMSGAFPEGFTPSLDLFLTPTFRGYLANYGTVLYPELHDCFYNAEFLELAKSYWNAEYAKPRLMLFNINGPCANRDPGHLDSPSFRGVRHENAPTWLCSVMGKSGLFQDYLIKMAQVITWFSLDESSGFTYWPDGPLKAPQRLLPPVYNRGVVVQNEMMVHRGEANGPLEQQIPAGLAFDTVFTGDPDDRDHWLLKNGDEVIARHHTDELRFLVHWSAEVFSDLRRTEEEHGRLRRSDDRSGHRHAGRRRPQEGHQARRARRAAARSGVHRRPQRRLRPRRAREPIRTRRR